MKIRSFSAQLVSGLLLTAVLVPATLSLTGCRRALYPDTQYNYSGRPTPPSNLFNRVLAAYSANGSNGGLEILDGLHDLRRNIPNTIPSWNIAGYAAAQPTTIINYPEETSGYVLSYTDGSVSKINYSTEAGAGSVASFGSNPPSVAASPTGSIFAGAAESAGVLGISSGGSGYSLNLPNVDKVVINQGATVILAMVRNSNSLYRVVKLPATNNPTTPPGAVDCQPLLLPVVCVVPVGGTYDHPINATFSLDGSTVYVENCGPECGGTTSGVTFLQEGALELTNIPTINPLAPTAPSPLVPLPVANPVPVPGGVTVANSDATTLYVAGQQIQSSGLLAGNLSLISLSTFKLTSTFPISDGTHTKLLFGDDNTLWIGSTQCASGVRAAAAAANLTTQAANDNCLTRFVINSTLSGGSNPVLPSWAANTNYNIGQEVTDGTNIEVVQTAGTSSSSTPTWKTTNDATTTDGSVTWVNIGPVTAAQVIPAVTPNSPLLPLQYVNTNLNNYYYGSLTGICWLQGLHKVYSAYGGQIHAFNTTDGSEIDNSNITIQGTVFDVAYMDALTNQAN